MVGVTPIKIGSGTHLQKQRNVPATSFDGERSVDHDDNGWGDTPPKAIGERSVDLPYCRRGYEMRQLVVLACSDCKNRNYTTSKNKQKTPDRLEMKKYCKFCKKHTAHKETK